MARTAAFGIIVGMKKLVCFLVFALLAAAAFGTVPPPPKSAVSEVSCLQMWPFERVVIINYKLDLKEGSEYSIKFFGSLDGGKTSFDLSEKGVLSRDGAEGTISSSGQHKTLWRPDDSFFGVVTEDMRIKVEVEEQGDLTTYMVVDLENDSISYRSKAPEGGWPEEYKLTKLVLRKIPAGTFTMGSPEDELGRSGNETPHTVTISKDFYIGVFEITQKQYELITGDDPSEYKGGARPVEHVSYKMLRGSEKGAAWPANGDVDDASFLGKLRAKAGMNFDLPTEAMWEMACRAETTTALNDGSNLTNQFVDGSLAKLGRYGANREDGAGGFGEHTVVGSYLPNAWGLYDMHGNVMEWCLDWYAGYDGDATDPVGGESGTYRIIRGGGYVKTAYDCRSAARGASDPGYGFYNYYGFRVVLVP